MKRILTSILLCAVLFFDSNVCASAQPPRVPEKFTWAGQTVSFDRADFYERMDRELIAFSFMHSTSILMLKRSDRIFKVVEPILKEEGLPDDLKYLMVIESNLDPTSVSPAGAAGLWQFMTATARDYGLEVNANIDERYNTEKATRAACKYLKKQYEKFGDWFAVACSYNAGPAAITSRMTAQKQTDPMELWMTSETSRYMFRVMAAKMMFEDPSAFGFHIGAADKYRYIEPKEVVTVTNEVPDLVAFAAKYGVTFAHLKEANLWLRESKLNNASHRTYKVIIPGDY